MKHNIRNTVLFDLNEKINKKREKSFYSIKMSSLFK